MSRFVLHVFFVISLYGSTFSGKGQVLPAAQGGASPAGLNLFYLDIRSLFGNEAGIAHLDHLSCVVVHRNFFAIPELSSQSIALAIPVQPGCFSINYEGSGISSFRFHQASLAFGKSLGKKMDAGVRLQYFIVPQMEEYKPVRAVSMSAGVLMEPTDRLLLAFHTRNPVHSSFAGNSYYILPVILQTGVGYRLSEELFLAAELEKDLQYDPALDLGFEYSLKKKLRITGGYHSLHGYYCGVGILTGAFQIHLAFSQHRYLGLSPVFMGGYQSRIE